MKPDLAKLHAELSACRAALEDISLALTRAEGPAPDAGAPERVQAIIRLVELAFDLPRGEILGTKRERHFAWPRQIAHTLAREHTLLSLAALGRLFKRDHVTISYSVKSVQDRMETDVRDSLIIERLSRKLQQEFQTSNQTKQINEPKSKP